MENERGLPPRPGPVFAREPIDPILTLDNVALSPHVGWPTTETLQRSLVVAVENLRRLRDDKTL